MMRETVDAQLTACLEEGSWWRVSKPAAWPPDIAEATLAASLRPKADSLKIKSCGAERGAVGGAYGRAIIGAECDAVWGAVGGAYWRAECGAYGRAECGAVE